MEISPCVCVGSKSCVNSFLMASQTRWFRMTCLIWSHSRGPWLSTSCCHWSVAIWKVAPVCTACDPDDATCCRVSWSCSRIALVSYIGWRICRVPGKVAEASGLYVFLTFDICFRCQRMNADGSFRCFSKMKGSDNQEKLVYQIIEDAGNKGDTKKARRPESKANVTHRNDFENVGSMELC